MNKIKSLKKNTFDEAFANAISVRNFDGTEIAKLVPIGNWALDDNLLIESFTKWRKTFMRNFLTHFTATENSMRDYLSGLSIPKNDRILFALYVGGKLMGHCGLCNVSSKSAEADNIIKGTSGGPKDLMYFSEMALLSWAFNQVGVEFIYTRILSKNFLSLSLFKRFGFSLKEKIPLKKVKKGNSVTYEECRKSEATETFFLDLMEVYRFDFFESIKSVK